MKNYWRSKRWIKIIGNKYVITGMVFSVWMLFFDDNSWLMQRELKKEIQSLEQSISYYKTELEADKAALKELRSNPDAFEKYARERFGMLRAGEELYVFEVQND